MKKEKKKKGIPQPKDSKFPLLCLIPSLVGVLIFFIISGAASGQLLKGILAGHLHITVQDRFSPTAMQYVVGGNFMFHGQEITFS